MASTPANTMLQRKQEEKKKLEIEKKKKKKNKDQDIDLTQPVEAAINVSLPASDVVSMSVIAFGQTEFNQLSSVQIAQPKPPIQNKGRMRGIVDALMSPFKKSEVKEEEDIIMGHISRAGIFMPFPVSFIEDNENLQNEEEF
ncbi:MAG: hypothetical protein EZS28_055951, partial [Streblomastix strix]